MGTKIKYNLIFQISYQLLTVLTPLITSPYLSRVLGAESLGKFSASQAFVNYYILFAMLGIGNYGVRSIAKIQQDRSFRSEEFWSIYIIQFFTSILSFSAYIISVTIFIPDTKKIIYFLQGLWILSSLLDINWFYSGTEQFKLTVIRSSIIKFLTIAAILLFVNSPDDLWIYILIMSGSMVLSQFVLWMLLPQFVDFLKPNLQKSRQHIFPILKLFIPVLAFSVFHIMDKTMLNGLSDDLNSGYYYNADKFANIPLGIITTVNTVFFPRITNTIHTQGNNAAYFLLEQSAELIMFLTCAISAGLGAISKTFVPVFFGPGYEPCITLLHWFVPVMIIKALSNYLSSEYLIPNSKDTLYTLSGVCGAVISPFIYYFLIHKYAALGAVIGTLIAEFIVLIVQIYGTRSEINFVTIFFKQGIYVIFAVIMSTLIILISDNLNIQPLFLLLIEISAGFICYMLLCCIYWRNNTDSIFYHYIKPH